MTYTPDARQINSHFLQRLERERESDSFRS